MKKLSGTSVPGPYLPWTQREYELVSQTYLGMPNGTTEEFRQRMAELTGGNARTAAAYHLYLSAEVTHGRLPKLRLLDALGQTKNDVNREEKARRKAAEAARLAALAASAAPAPEPVSASNPTVRIQGNGVFKDFYLSHRPGRSHNIKSTAITFDVTWETLWSAIESGHLPTVCLSHRHAAANKDAAAEMCILPEGALLVIFRQVAEAGAKNFKEALVSAQPELIRLTAELGWCRATPRIPIQGALPLTMEPTRVVKEQPSPEDVKREVVPVVKSPFSVPVSTEAKALPVSEATQFTLEAVRDGQFTAEDAVDLLPVKDKKRASWALNLLRQKRIPLTKCVELLAVTV